MKTFDILVVYDVQTTTPKGKRRLRRVAQLCKNHGQRVQFSVFECRVTQAQMESLEADSLDILDITKDSLRIYILHQGRERSLHAHGVDRYRDFDEPLIL
jgi:CRISPR-associated protein Cas2